jgi:hypothetical protein
MEEGAEFELVTPLPGRVTLQVDVPSDYLNPVDIRPSELFPDSHIAGFCFSPKGDGTWGMVFCLVQNGEEGDAEFDAEGFPHIMEVMKQIHGDGDPIVATDTLRSLMEGDAGFTEFLRQILNEDFPEPEEGALD